ncbi:MAG: hypothetical protein ACR2LM_17945 [Pyrinomonadaceae bacterium]
MKPILLVIVMLAASTFARAQVFPAPEGEIVRRYDRFTNKTTISLVNLQVAERNDDLNYQRLYLRVGSQFESERPSHKPGFVIIIFSSWSLWNDRYTQPSRLDAIVDGQRKSYGDFPPVRRDEVNGKYVVTLLARMDFADFIALVSSKKAELRLGDLEFRLNDHAFKMLRDFAKQIQP